MSFEETLREKAKAQALKGNYLNMQDIGQTMSLKWVKEDYRNDKRGNDCGFVTLITESGQTVIQKFTPTAFAQLADAIDSAGGLEELKKNFHIYEKRKIGRAIFDRLYPTAEVSKPKKK